MCGPINAPGSDGAINVCEWFDAARMLTLYPNPIREENALGGRTHRL